MLVFFAYNVNEFFSFEAFYSHQPRAEVNWKREKEREGEDKEVVVSVEGGGGEYFVGIHFGERNFHGV